MTNDEYWKEYERVTGEKRPPWIDGVGNVNQKYYQNMSRPQRQPDPTPARVSANYMPVVRPAQMSRNLMPTEQQVQEWKPGLRGWRPGW